MATHSPRPHAQIPVAVAVALAALGVAGCLQVKEVPGLTAKTDGPAPGVSCVACHAYPLRDTNHVFHLFETDSNITSDRPITCLHCHDRSIAAHPEPFIDSIFRDSSGNEFHALDFPDDPELRTFPLVRVETLVNRRPVPAPPRPGPLPEIREWVTGLAHLNGVVDVEFDSTSVDTGRFHGQRAYYHPREQTCSSVDCHPNHGAYRWAVPSRGLPILKGDTSGHEASSPRRRPLAEGR